MSNHVTVTATWNGTVLAASNGTIRVEGNHYFPADSVHWDHLVGSASHTVCVWKGIASYYTVVVGDQRNEDAAWCYPHPSPFARRIKDRVAFWRGVEIVEETTNGAQ
jgi:uncharacterized protein (DUF427 family)